MGRGTSFGSGGTGSCLCMIAIASGWSATNGGIARQALISHHAERVHVRGTRQRLAGRLLGRDVQRGAHHDAGRGQAEILYVRLGDAEVGDLGGAVGHDQQVARLDVPVHDAGPVRGVKRAGRLRHDVEDDVRLQPPVPLEDLRQRLPVDQLHHQVRPAERAVLAVVEDPGDPRVRQRRRVPRLGPEPRPELLVVGVDAGHHLDRDRPAEEPVVTAPDLTHPAGSDPLDQRVTVVENILGSCH